MTKSKPKTGEKRDVHQPLKIDLLPEDARQAILRLRDQGYTWPEIEERSAKPYSAEWAKNTEGFINWESFPLKLLEQFPKMRLPKTSLHRWFDLRIAQVRSQVLAEGEKARQWAAALATKNLPEANAAVVNAMRDQVFALMQHVGPGDQAKFLDGLNVLGLTMSRLQRVELQAKRVDVDARRIKLLEDREQRAKDALDQVTKEAAKKGTGQFSIEDMNLLRERTFGLPPLVIAHG